MKKFLFIIFLASTTLHTSSEVFAMERKRISDEISDEISKEKPESQKEQAPEQKRKKQEDAQDPESAAGIAGASGFSLPQARLQQGQLVNSGAAVGSSKVAPTNAPVIVSTQGWSELHIAAKDGNLEKIKQLLTANPAMLDLKIDALGTKFNGNTALHMSARYGHKAIVEYLVEKFGANRIKNDILIPIMEKGPNQGVTALTIAFGNGSIEILKYFAYLLGNEKFKEAVLTPIATGPNPGETSFHLAAGAGRVEVLRYFEELFVNDIDRIRHVVLSPLTKGYNAFYIAVACGRTDVLKYFAYLLGNEKFKEIVLTPVATGPHTGKTPLHVTAEAGRLDILKYFVEVFGVDIDIIRQAILRPIAEGDLKGYTAFQMAAYRGQKAIIEYFCEKILDNNIHMLRQAILIPITSGPNAKITAFNIAARNGRIEVVEYFGKFFREEILGAQKKEDIHALGYSAIEMAAGGGSIPVLEYFVKQFGADQIKQQLLSTLNVGARGGLDSAVAGGHVDVLNFVLDKFFHAGQIAEFADTVLRRITEISRKSNDVSGLYHAASNGHVKIFRYFCDILFMCHNLDYVRTVILQPLSNGANQGLTVVHLAVCNKRKELIEFFVNVFGKNVLKIPAGHGPNAGKTPLDMATDLHDEEFSKYIDALSK
ncbi:MAG: ankyrin repeat domain-containing protein [Candidatus Babeliales bacterium]|nr:MAG: hypothetical protein US22_C0026G0003 [candidate division TM6 bacterium GW2011_GWF2_36_6]